MCHCEAFRPKQSQKRTILDCFASLAMTKMRFSRERLRKFRDLERGLYYGNSYAENETYAMDYKIGWAYYGYPDEPRGGTARGQAADMQEIYATLSWPKICPMGIVPSYTIVSMWPSESNSTVRNNGGWLLNYFNRQAIL